MHMCIHIYHNYIYNAQFTQTPSSQRQHQEKEPLHLPGNADRFHGLLSQRAIEVPWLVSVSGKGHRIDNDLLVGSVLVGLRRTS